MLDVEIGGIAEAFANLTERVAIDPHAKATLTLGLTKHLPSVGPLHQCTY